jgi:hypothetical protein
MMKDIIEVYRQITFENIADCVVTNSDASRLFEHGQVLVNVNATLKNFEMKIPDKYKKEHESYSLNISKSQGANEGIVAHISADYYPGYV